MIKANDLYLKLIEPLELRIIKATFYAGATEIMLRVITQIGFMGYLGLGMVLLSGYHYIFYKKAKKGE